MLGLGFIALVAASQARGQTTPLLWNCKGFGLAAFTGGIACESTDGLEQPLLLVCAKAKLPTSHYPSSSPFVRAGSVDSISEGGLIVVPFCGCTCRHSSAVVRDKSRRLEPWFKCGLVKFPVAQHIIRYTVGIVELDELLTSLVNDVDGALGAAIGGMDGLLIEQYAADPSLNLDTIIAEHANILKSIKAAYSVSLTAGNVTEILITAEQIMGFTKEVTSEFFLTIVLEPKGNVGKARLLGQQAAGRIREVVS